jgi:flagellar motor protein MotB
MRLYQELNSAMATQDTPRGLVVTVPDADFRGSEASGNWIAQASRIVAILARHPELRVDVQGYSDTAEGATLSGLRAESVRRILAERGLPADRISARGLGDSRPVTSNATAAGRIANRRVEVVITGDSIGNLPAWGHTYSLLPGR